MPEPPAGFGDVAPPALDVEDEEEEVEAEEEGEEEEGGVIFQVTRQRTVLGGCPASFITGTCFSSACPNHLLLCFTMFHHLHARSSRLPSLHHV